MRSIVLVLCLWSIAPSAHAQWAATAPSPPPPASFGYKLLGGFVGHAIALTLSAGVLALALSNADSGGEDYGDIGAGYGAVAGSAVFYAAVAPLLIGGGVQIAGSLSHRDGRFDLAFGGAALGMLSAVLLTVAMQASTEDGDASGIVLVATGLTLPPVFSALFSELLSDD